jgi:hypothetical protein
MTPLRPGRTGLDGVRVDRAVPGRGGVVRWDSNGHSSSRDGDGGGKD